MARREKRPKGDQPVALVTGASAGIGESFARKLAERRHDLVLVARRKDRLEAIAEELREAHGTNSLVLAEDLGTAGGPRKVFEAVQGAGLRIELLVNNAGYGTTGPFQESEHSRELGQIDLNVRALVALSHLFGQRMVERGSGAIVNVGSVASFMAVPYMSTYAATKAFVLSFSQALAEELAGHGVHVMCVCPGGTATEFQAVAGMNTAAVESTFMSADAVVDIALADLEARRRVSISGWMNRLSVLAAKLVPTPLLSKGLKLGLGKLVEKSEMR